MTLQRLLVTQVKKGGRRVRLEDAALDRRPRAREGITYVRGGGQIQQPREIETLLPRTHDR
jgi:hypothetical protein